MNLIAIMVRSRLMRRACKSVVFPLPAMPMHSIVVGDFDCSVCILTRAGKADEPVCGVSCQCMQ